MSCTIARKPLPSGVQIEDVYGSISDVGMSWKPQDTPQKDMNGWWSMVNMQAKAGDSSSRGSLDSITMVDHHSRSPFRSPVESQSNLHLQVPSRPRTHSAYSYGSDRSQPSPPIHARSSSASDTQPSSWIDLLHSSYPQLGPAIQLGNAHLQSAVGNKASLLSHKQTFDMYLANVKKTDDPAVQYEFALLLLTKAMQDEPVVGPGSVEMTQAGVLKEAKVILQRLADRSYPFAQYYLGDGYASGLFSKDKEDYDRAFPLFVAASKHGHVEACYRAALCYEFGWGTRVEAARAAQFYRQAASKNHPGAMLRMAQACLAGDMGLGRKRYREGVKWMKRASESSDTQYNSAPYELGLLHETGYGDDVFPDASYAAQLFTRSAELGHAEASYRLGDAYEHGLLHCPRDPGLSIHFYTGAAQQGHPLAMMALCAWYMVGAEPVLERDENEAYEWAKRAADLGRDCNPLIFPVYLYANRCRTSQSAIRRGILYRNGPRVPTRSIRGHGMVCARGGSRRRSGETTARDDPCGSQWNEPRGDSRELKIGEEIEYVCHIL